MKTKVVIYYMLLILKCNFCFVVKGRLETTYVSPHIEEENAVWVVTYNNIEVASFQNNPLVNALYLLL